MISAGEVCRYIKNSLVGKQTDNNRMSINNQMPHFELTNVDHRAH
jgi:hypothetical protein